MDHLNLQGGIATQRFGQVPESLRRQKLELAKCQTIQDSGSGAILAHIERLAKTETGQLEFQVRILDSGHKAANNWEGETTVTYFKVHNP